MFASHDRYHGIAWAQEVIISPMTSQVPLPPLVVAKKMNFVEVQGRGSILQAIILESFPHVSLKMFAILYVPLKNLSDHVTSPNFFLSSPFSPHSVGISRFNNPDMWAWLVKMSLSPNPILSGMVTHTHGERWRRRSARLRRPGARREVDALAR